MIRYPVTLIKRNLHNSLNKSNMPGNFKLEYGHFLLSSINCIIICGGLYSMEQYNKKINNLHIENIKK